ncbi:ABC transporter permease [Nisaea acidiphila]|uniref:ABC transporter permease n=1 Tax=Nisaea acidiphila TaxID=1862145 RepID=A0A9J7AVF1_9PROT|nr:ABC transporter permease [Nisaea acidiphila]UUX50778.1 ABC transporter permease [Nisaea acidiphila]
MTAFLIRRLGQALLVLWLMSFVTYGLLVLMPGDPVDLMLAGDPNVTAADVTRLRALHGLDRPFIERYGEWLGNAVQGDFGYSRLFAAPVTDILAPRLLNSLLLMGLAFALAVAIALPASVLAARHPGSLADRAINLFCFAGISVPPFWLALLLILLFAVALGLFPASGMATIGDGGLADRAAHLVLPVLTLAAASVAQYTRHGRAAMVEVLREDYIRTARAKGARERTILWRHGFRNALIPLVTIMALDFGALFSGALITETMFAYLGIGKTIYDAVMGNDFNLALVGLLLATAVTLAANIAADVAYGLIDPRIRLTGRKSA